MAIVDTLSSEIIGAKPNTLTYFHEKAHIIYSKSKKGMRNSFLMEGFFILTVVFLALRLFFPFLKVLVLSSIILFIGFYIYEEIWCWIFAFKKKIVHKGSKEILPTENYGNLSEHRKVYKPYNP